ncbi:MAG: phosphoribosylaminoimidazolesuccinocarboxamide synthase [Aquificae bacterium]|jgi:phosphoribosylaminoimidazole-succinocarboxamide synthase|nr:phosphoribosylaminoimidazolesuccinocarboxamide synthase [Aquificota bacterium]
MEKGKKLYEGKAKIIYATEEPDKVVIYFKDDTTAFDGIKKEQIAGKGVINNTISSLIFELLQKRGIPTHYIKKLSDREMLAYRVEIIPVEVVVRNYAAGSFTRRYGIPEGTKLEKPLVETFWKNDELHDPLVCNEHIELLKLADLEDVKKMKEMALVVNEVLKDFFAERNIILVDFKLEFGKTPDGRLVLADEISPDSCRLWDAKTMKKLDKDVFRYDLGSLEEAYKEVLKRLENK